MVYFYLIVQVSIQHIVERNHLWHLISIVIKWNLKVKRNYHHYHLQLFHHLHHRNRIHHRVRNSCQNPIISFNNNKIFLNNVKQQVWKQFRIHLKSSIQLISKRIIPINRGMINIQHINIKFPHLILVLLLIQMEHDRHQNQVSKKYDSLCYFITSFSFPSHLFELNNWMITYARMCTWKKKNKELISVDRCSLFQLNE